jgi:two-component system LytT family response regulator
MIAERIQVVIVDDETHCSEAIDILLKQLTQSVEVVGKFNDPRTALTFLQNHSCDIVFLDIEMPNLSGFDLLNKLSSFSFDVVFTTAYDQYAIQAFDFSALSYLLKPVDEGDLQACINRWVEKKQKFLRVDQFGLFLEMMKGNAITQSKIALPTTDGLEFIHIANIIRCQAESNYTSIFLNTGESFLICRTLKDVETILRHHSFIRIHQSHLINLMHLRKYARADGGYIVMTDDVQLSISRAYKQQVQDAISRVERL